MLIINLHEPVHDPLQLIRFEHFFTITLTSSFFLQLFDNGLELLLDCEGCSVGGGDGVNDEVALGGGEAVLGLTGLKDVKKRLVEEGLGHGWVGWVVLFMCVLFV
jgi:hypothetical protein